MTAVRTRKPAAVTPRVGFVSLGCPKALVDSERILTQLRAEGYLISGSYRDADLVVVNTCGFIDAAVEESLDTIGEALAENGKVIVTGCLGAKGSVVKDAHPRVLAVTGPHATEEVMNAVHLHLPKPHDPFVDLVPPQGIKLTPKHFAYLKIAEGCNHRCTFCIIPSMRGDLVSRPVGEVMQEAENLVKAGVRELLVISQDTSAYGVDIKYRTGFWGGRPLKTRMTELVQALGELGVWVRLHYVYPYPHVDEVLPLMAASRVLPYLDVPFQHASPRILKLMKRPANAENNLERIRAWREICPDLTIRSTFIAGFSGETRDERAADDEVGTDFAPSANAFQVVLRVRRALHQPENARAGMLEGYVEIGQYFAMRHQRQDFVDVRVRIDVVQAHPYAEFAQSLHQFGHAGFQRPSAPEAGAVLDVDAIGAGVLRDHQQFPDAGLHQIFGFLHDLANRTADQVAAHRRNDTERAAMVAAFGDLQIGKVFWRELDALWRHQVRERVVRPRQMIVNRAHDLVGGVGAGDRKHLRMRLPDHVALSAEAAGDDDLAVLGERFTDGIKRLFDCGVNEAAGIDHDQIRVLVAGGNEVALRAKLREDALRIHQCFRAAERNETDSGLSG